MDVLKGKIRREFAALEEQVDHMFERAFGSGLRVPSRADRYRPALDVYETSDAILVTVELAGVRPEDVHLTVDGEYLQITGQRGVASHDSPTRHLRMEIPQGPFERVLRFRDAYDPDAVEASLDAGLLRVRLPKQARVAQRIPVQGE